MELFSMINSLVASKVQIQGQLERGNSSDCWPVEQSGLHMRPSPKSLQPRARLHIAGVRCNNAGFAILANQMARAIVLLPEWELAERSSRE